MDMLSVMYLVATTVHGASARSVADTPFVQEYREFYVVADNDEANDVCAVAADATGALWTATPAGVFRFTDGTWQPMLPEANRGPAFAAEADAAGGVWLGAWNGLYCSSEDGEIAKVEGIDSPVAAIACRDNIVVAMGPGGLWHNRGGNWQHERGPWADSAHAALLVEDGSVWMASNHGLFHIAGTEVVQHIIGEEEIRSGETADIAFGPDGRLWSCGNSGLDIYEAGKRVASVTPSEGLPYSEVQSLDFAPDGTLWIGTAHGVARYDGHTWSLRHSLRWLPSDDVRDVAFGADGTAYVATAAGISAIKRRTMTLEEKATYFHQIVMARKVRAPWLVEKSRLLTPGDVSTWSAEDDDNDGEYTSDYLAMEACRYKATGDPEARRNAERAFDALEFLQTVTGTDGFIARTVVPVEWAGPENENPHRFHDANRTYTPQEIAAAHVRDPRYKCVEERWRPSADGRWLWKGDTSSDEICGHYFAYLYYYDLIADTEPERERVRALVRRVTDYLIDGGLVLKDIDGTHTRWGVWSPELLLEDPDWRTERPVNCTEILSFLKTAFHITGDAKYQDHYRRLIDEHGYAEWARKPKPTDPSERTNIDSILLAHIFPVLIKYEEDPELHAIYAEGLRQWFEQIRAEYSPFYNFICGAFGVENFGLDACVDFLRDAPLDLIRWTVDNRAREDIRLVRYPELSPLQTDRLLPASERGVMRWDKNPWQAVAGDGGHTESSGVYWLLPYWLGRYYGFIQAPE